MLPYVEKLLAFFTTCLMRGSNGKRQTSARRKSPFDSHAAGVAHGDQVVENSIHDLFVERRRVAKRSEVILQGFRLHAFDGGHIFDDQLGVVGLAGHGAK